MHMRLGSTPKTGIVMLMPALIHMTRHDHMTSHKPDSVQSLPLKSKQQLLPPQHHHHISVFVPHCNGFSINMKTITVPVLLLGALSSSLVIYMMPKLVIILSAWKLNNGFLLSYFSDCIWNQRNVHCTQESHDSPKPFVSLLRCSH